MEYFQQSYRSIIALTVNSARVVGVKLQLETALLAGWLDVGCAVVTKDPHLNLTIVPLVYVMLKIRYPKQEGMAQWMLP